MKTKTSELTGAALDWAVAAALGLNPILGQYCDEDLCFYWCFRVSEFLEGYSPSTNWAQGGPLVDKYLYWLEQQDKNLWAVAAVGGEIQYGATILIAICRGVVSCKLGEDVDVPDELVGGAA